MSTKKQRQYIARRLAQAGLEPHAVAGIMGNINAESAFSPTARNGSSGAYGLVQWLGDRKTGLEAYARSKGKSASNLDVQIDYIIKEIRSGNQSGRTGTVTIESLNRLSGPGEVAEFFDTNYERSEGTTVAARRSAAQQYHPMVQRVAGSKGARTAGETPKVPGSSGGEMTWVPKVGSEVSNSYGAKNSRYAAGYHTGADIPGGSGGQPIRWAPPVSGKVVKRGTSGAYGNHMIIRDEKGRDWLLAHMAGAPLKVGTKVSQGDRIGTVGNTGNSDGAHLHIEMTAPGDKWKYGGTKKPKLVFKVGPDGQTYDKDFNPTSSDFMDQVGLSGQALNRSGNEELKKLVDEAVANDWTTQEFTRRYKATKWYRTRAESQRTFDTLQDTDQQQQVKQAQAEARAVAARLGVTLTDKQLRRLATMKARDGFTNEQMQWWIGRRYTGEGDQSGQALSVQESLKTLARDYGIRIDTPTMTKWTKEVLMNGTSPDAYADNMRDIAAQQNPYLRDAYQRGLTTREALQSYIGTAAQLMGKSEDDIDLSDPKWREVFDPNGNPMSDAAWTRKIKSEAKYGYGNTNNGISEARMHGQNLLRVMGAFSG